jgi:hypothetical protein
MRRRLTAMLATVVITVMLAAVPAFADKGGVIHDGSCGLGYEVHVAIADQNAGPGASEYGTGSPLEAGCTGKG